MTASFTLLVLSSKDRGASNPSILYPKEESGSHCLLIFDLKPRSAGLKFGSTIFTSLVDRIKPTETDKITIEVMKMNVETDGVALYVCRNTI